jgi:hypothetical protein
VARKGGTSLLASLGLNLGFLVVLLLALGSLYFAYAVAVAPFLIGVDSVSEGGPVVPVTIGEPLLGADDADPQGRQGHRSSSRHSTRTGSRRPGAEPTPSPAPAMGDPV